MLLKISDGCLEVDAEGYISLSREFCNFVENDIDLIAHVFLELQQNLSCDQWLCARAILAPKNEVVSRINTDILKEVQGEMKEYLSMDTELSTSYPVELYIYVAFPKNHGDFSGNNFLYSKKTTFSDTNQRQVSRF
ncbi:ATP-dependent DNA helicase [Trichonephila clavipes]|nr:ATP-dependent DNA helicase [Trichonephila clavipes]